MYLYLVFRCGCIFIIIYAEGSIRDCAGFLLIFVYVVYCEFVKTCFLFYCLFLWCL